LLALATTVTSVTIRNFEIICEIEPPTRADLMHVRHQIGVLSKVASLFLIPDNHLGRATVSSVAVAHEVEAMGGRCIACLNARDRNLLGFRRDLLTAAAYGVDQFLLVYGDEPIAGARSGELTVQAMLDELRTFASRPETAHHPFRAGVTTRLTALPPWKQQADFLFVQVGFDVDELLRWRDGIDFDGPVYAGVMVLASGAMATKLSGQLSEVQVPPGLVDRIDADPSAGVDFACDQLFAIRETGAFDGVHLIPVTRYRDVTAKLESQLA
jgi:5,10-methylenetetrahydrofolate reductase